MMSVKMTMPLSEAIAVENAEEETRLPQREQAQEMAAPWLACQKSRVSSTRRNFYLQVLVLYI